MELERGKLAPPLLQNSVFITFFWALFSTVKSCYVSCCNSVVSPQGSVKGSTNLGLTLYINLHSTKGCTHLGFFPFCDFLHQVWNSFQYGINFREKSEDSVELSLPTFAEFWSNFLLQLLSRLLRWVFSGCWEDINVVQHCVGSDF